MKREWFLHGTVQMLFILLQGKKNKTFKLRECLGKKEEK